MKKQIFAAAVLLVVGATPVWAVDVTGNGSLVSEYVWRGVPASDEKAAVQLGADAEWDNGWYAGVWGSNAATPDQSGVEIDLYGGWGSESGDWNYGVGGTFYTFTDRVAEDFLELNLSGGWKMLTLDVAIGEYDSSPSQEYVFTSLTGEYKKFYATLGYWGWESDASLDDGGYFEAGYSSALTVNGAYIFDYKLAYIYSEQELLFATQGRNRFVLGITRNFGIYSK